MPKDELNKALKEAKLAAELRAIRRKDIVDSVEIYSGLVTSKLSGLGLMVVSGLEILSPEVISAIALELGNAAALGGVGLALLGGKKVLKIVKAALNEIDGGGNGE